MTKPLFRGTTRQKLAAHSLAFSPFLLVWRAVIGPTVD